MSRTMGSFRHRRCAGRWCIWGHLGACRCIRVRFRWVRLGSFRALLTRARGRDAQATGDQSQLRDQLRRLRQIGNTREFSETSGCRTCAREPNPLAFPYLVASLAPHPFARSSASGMTAGRTADHSKRTCGVSAEIHDFCIRFLGCSPLAFARPGRHGAGGTSLTGVRPTQSIESWRHRHDERGDCACSSGSADGHSRRARRGARAGRGIAMGGVYALPGGRIMCIGGASNMATRCPHCRRWSGMDRWN
jgi:hypothetical protein